MKNKPNWLLEIIKGVLLLLSCYIAAFVLLLVMTAILNLVPMGWVTLGTLTWIIFAYSFFIWQIFYVIPLAIRLKRRGKIGMMQGVIGASVCTALVNVAYLLSSDL